jgi:aryl-alcohol dehydrogenase-like predicted oxidoreductase
MMTIPHVKLKHTDLVVFRFCFGTITLGKPMRATSNTILRMWNALLGD